MKYFTGIDVSLRFVASCVIDEVEGMQCRGQDPRRSRRQALG